MVELSFNNEQEWHALRHAHIGGSEIAALFDVQPAYMADKCSLWKMKAGLVSYPEINNDLVRWGTRLEKPIAEGIAEDNGWTIRKGGYYQDDACPFLGASLDYEIISDIPGKDGPGVFEIKNVNPYAFSKSWTDGEPPIHIILQLQHQMAATGYKWGAIGALVGGNKPELFFYDARPTMIDAIRKNVGAFKESLDNKIAPPMGGAASNKAILKEQYPELMEDELDLTKDNEISFICDEYQKKTIEKKAMDQEVNRLKNTIMEKMLGHKKVIANGYKISLAISPAKPDRPASIGEIIKGRSESRRLIVKEFENV